MAKTARWRKAVAVSLLLHGILLVGVGWMAAKIFEAPEIQQYIELELISGPEASPSGPSFQAGTVSIPAALPAAAPQPVPEDPPVYQEKVTTAQAVTGSMSVSEVEAGSGEAGAAGSPGGGGAGLGAGAGSGAGAGDKAGKGGGIVPPAVLSKVEPRYPEEARKAGQYGTVILRIQILENGRPGEISVYSSSGYGLLDDAAVSAVAKWRFVPAKERDSGRALVCYTTMPVVFKLRS